MASRSPRCRHRCGKKVRYLTEELGFDAGLDYHASDFAECLRKACPKGMDIYFENFGGRGLGCRLPVVEPAGPEAPK
jgi:NADPH-dependent curcumin reductase CurA